MPAVTAEEQEEGAADGLSVANARVRSGIDCFATMVAETLTPSTSAPPSSPSLSLSSPGTTWGTGACGAGDIILGGEDGDGGGGGDEILSNKEEREWKRRKDEEELQMVLLSFVGSCLMFSIAIATVLSLAQRQRLNNRETRRKEAARTQELGAVSEDKGPGECGRTWWW